jgi:hypothetical protein
MLLCTPDFEEQLDSVMLFWSTLLSTPVVVFPLTCLVSCQLQGLPYFNPNQTISYSLEHATGLRRIRDCTRIPSRQARSQARTTMQFEPVQELEHACFREAFQAGLVEVLQAEFHMAP